MRNRIFGALILAVLHLLQILAHDFEAENEDGVTIYYRITTENDGNVWVTYKGRTYENHPYSGTVRIPSEVEFNEKTYSVTGIDDNAFRGCASLQEVEIPNSVEHIGGYAFADCSHLTAVKLGNSVGWINGRAFMGCSSLMELSVPGSVRRIGDLAFSGCKDLSRIVFEDGEGTLVFGSNSFDEGLFTDCNLASLYLGRDLSYSVHPFRFKADLEEIVIGEKVTNIGEYLFEGCSSIKELSIPSSVCSIGSYALAFCSSLSKVVFEDGDEVLQIESNSFQDCPLTEIYLGRDLGYFSGRGNSPFNRKVKLEEVELGERVTFLKSFLFNECSALRKVSMGNSVTSIQGGAFRYCSSLSDLTISENWADIGDFAFEGCSSLKEISLPNTLTKIGDSAFRDCSSISEVVIPNSVTKLGEEAFAFCTSLVELTIGNSVASIEKFAFTGCSALEKVVVPSSVTSIGNSAFADCSSLKEVTLPHSVSSIRMFAFSGCSSLEEITIPNSVENIENFGFSGCSSLSRVVIEDGEEVLDLGYNMDDEGMFFGCPLRSVYVGRELSYAYDDSDYGRSPFYGKNELMEVIIGENVKSINRKMFYGCSALMEITIPSSIEYIKKNAFYGCESLFFVRNMSGLKIVKGSTDNGYVGYYAKVVSEGEDFYHENGLYFNDKEHTQLAWFDGSRKAVVIPSTVTSIDSEAFKDCRMIVSLTVGTNVASIGKDAFSGCSFDKVVWLPNTEPEVRGAVTYVSTSNVSTSSSLKRLDFLNSKFEVEGVKYVPLSMSDRTCLAIDYDYDEERSELPLNAKVVYRGVEMRLKELGEFAFSQADRLTKTSIPESVERLGDCSFKGCTALEEVSIDDSEAALPVGSSAFGDCPLTTLHLGRNVSYSQSPFEKKEKLVSATLSDFVTVLPYDLFRDCSSLPSISIPKGVEEMGAHVFDGCKSLKEIVIPNSLSYISDYAFNDCASLSSATLHAKVASIGEFAFFNCQSLEGIELPSALNEIGGYAFSNSGLKSIVVPDLIRTINEATFKDCSQLKKAAIGEKVESLEFAAFKNCGLETISIPRNVQSIAAECFSDCTALEEVSLGAGVQMIGELCFSNCTALESLFVPASVKEIKRGVLSGATNFSKVETPSIKDWCGISFEDETANPVYYCHTLFVSAEEITDLVVPEEVATVPDYAFYTDKALTSVSFSSKTQALGREAFRGCEGLEALSVPSSMKSIGDGCFKECTGLKELAFVDGYSDLEMGSDVYAEAPLEKITLGRNLAYYSDYSSFRGMKTLKEVVITDAPTVVGNSLFRDCENISALALGSHLKFIRQYAFSGCKKIPSLEFGPSLVIVGLKAFYGCELVENLEFDKNLKELDYLCFANCQSLKHLVFLDGKEEVELGQDVFLNTALETITIGRNLVWADDYGFKAPFYGKKTIRSVSFTNKPTMIEKNMFYDCENLEYLSLGTEIRSIGDYAFFQCQALPAVVFGMNVESIGNGCFANCTAMKEAVFVDGEGTIEMGNGVFSNVPLQKVRIGRNLSYPTEGGVSPFSKMNTLTSAWITDIPTEVGDYLFFDCEKLKDVSLGDAVETIGEYAFSGCQSLELFAFGRNVREIKREAFSDCTALVNIYAEPMVPPTCCSQALDDIDHWQCTLHVHAEAKAEYQVADQWKEFLFVDDDFGITLNLSMANMMAGDEISLEALSEDEEITWISTNTDLVSVDDEGRVKALRAGRTSVFAITSDGLMANCEIKVQGVLAEEINLNVEELELRVGEQEELKVEFIPENTTDKTITWTSSDEKIAEVSESGVITAVAPGTAIITATAVGGAKADCVVTVIEKGEDGIEAPAVASEEEIRISKAFSSIRERSKHLKPSLSPPASTSLTARNSG